MANQLHLGILNEGVRRWNEWRQQNPDVQPDLNAADLHDRNLQGINLSQARLHGVSEVSDSSMLGLAMPGRAVPGSGGRVFPTNLSGANLRDALLVGADLTGADLRYASLVNTDMRRSNISGCRVFGTAAWNLHLEGAIQRDLVITPDADFRITTDNLEVAQFIYLLLNNQKIRHVIDTITSKVVLILGRFSPERKPILDAIRDELRKRDYLPVLFDFEKPSNKTTLETVSTLAHMARFVIADITDAKSVLQELQAVVPANPSVPIQPVMLHSQTEPGMFDFFKMFPWMLEPFLYADQGGLVAALSAKVIQPAESKAKEQTGRP